MGTPAPSQTQATAKRKVKKMYNSDNFGPCDSDSANGARVFSCECKRRRKEEIARTDESITEFAANPLEAYEPEWNLTGDQKRRIKQIRRSKITHFGHSMSVARALEIGPDPIQHAREVGAAYETRSSTGGAMWGVSRVGCSEAEWRAEWWEEHYAFAGGAVCAAVRDAANRGALVAIVDGLAVACEGTTGIDNTLAVNWTEAVDQAKAAISVQAII